MTWKKWCLLTCFTLSSQLFSATQTWSGGAFSNTNWSAGPNWQSGTPPASNDSVVFPSTASTYTSTCDISAYPISAMTLDSASYNINGPLLYFTEMGTGTITFNAGATVSIGNLNCYVLDINGNAPSMATISSSIGADEVVFNGTNVTITGANNFVTITIGSVTANSNLTSWIDSIYNATAQLGTNATLTLIKSGSSPMLITETGGAGGKVTIGDGTGTYNIALTGLSPNYSSYTGGTTVTANSTLQVSTLSLPSTGGVTVNSNGILNFNQSLAGSPAGTYTGVITGSGAVEISGGGSVYLNQTNTYMGGTTVASSTLIWSNDNNLGSGSVTLGTAATDTPILQASGSFTTTKVINLVATQSTIDPNGNTLTHMLPGGVSGTGGLLIGRSGVSAGTLLVDTAYSYTGGTTIVLGTLQLGMAGSMPAPGVSPQGDLNLQGSSTIFNMSAASSTVTIGNLEGTAGSHIDLGSVNFVVTSSTNTTFAGNIAGSSTGEFVKDGTATLSLQGTNTYSSGTIINAGILALTGAGVIPDAPMTINTGGTFDMSLTSVSPQTISDLGGTGGTLVLGGNTLNYVQVSNSTTFPGTITSSSGLFNMNAPGLNYGLTLTASSPFFAGPFTITQGTLLAGIANIFPNSGVLTVASTNSAFSLQGYNQTIGNLAGTSSPGTVSLGSATLTVGGNNQNSTYIGAIVGPGSLTKTGTGILSLSGPLSYTNATVNSGKIAITGNGTIAASPFPSISIASGAAYDVSGATAMQPIGNLSGTGMLIIGTSRIDYDPSSSPTTFNGTMTSTSPGEFNLANSSTLILTTPSPNFAGSFLITSGTLQAGASNLFPNVNPFTVNGTFNINTTSQTINNFSSSSTGTVSLGTGGSITLGGNNMPLTLSCIIQGTGQVIKTGTNTLTYNRSETYSGGTMVNNGTLAANSIDVLPPHGTITVASGATLSTGGNMQIIGSLAGSGTVSFGAAETLLVGSDGTATTFSGMFMGGSAPTLEVQTPGNLTLAGLDAYFGASVNTTIDANATLNMGQSLALPPGTVTVNGTLATQGNDQIINTIAGNGSIAFSDNENLSINAGTFAGQISGPGAVFIEGPVTYTGSTSYTGGTDIDMAGSSLTVSGSGTLPSIGLFNVSSGTQLIVNVPSATIGTLQGLGTCVLGANALSDNAQQNSIYGGNFTGTGTFTHAGPYQLTLSGNSSGPTSPGGIVAALGSLNVIGNYSTVPFEVGGAGFLKGTGSVGALTSFGTVAPGGSIGTLTAASYDGFGTLQIEVNPAGQASVLAVTGLLHLEPSSILFVVPDPGVYPPMITYTIATYGSESGTFAGATSTLFNRYKVVQINYDPPGAITIVLGTTPYSNISSFPAAGCIESIPQGPGTDGTFVISTLDGISNSISALNQAFAELEPKQYGALALAQENNDILIRSALTQRFYQQCKRDCTPAEPWEQNGTFWVEPLGKYADQNRQQQNLGYTAGTGGALLGTDYQFANHFYLGCAFGYTYTKLNWKESAGKADINSYYSTLYSTWFNKRAFIDATIITAYNQYHADRKIHFPGVHRTAHNHHRGYQVGTSLGSGVFFTPDDFQVTPYARLDYVFLHQNGFTESGAESLNLKVNDTNSRYFRSDAGVKVAYCRRYDSVAVTPYIKASWIFEKQLDDAKFRAGFVHSSCKFNTNGLHPVRNLFAPSVGVTVLAYEDTFSFEFHDDVEVSRRFWENRVYLNFAYRF